MDTMAKGGNVSRPLQFNLRTLLFAFAAISIPLTLMRWLGVHFVAPIIFSCLLVCVSVRSYRVAERKKIFLAVGISLPIALAFAFFHMVVTMRVGATEALFFHAIINAGLCVVCVLLRCSRPLLTTILILGGVIPYYEHVVHMQEVRQRFDQMLADYPLESLDARLSFESERTDEDIESFEVAADTRLSATVLANLDLQQHRPDWGRQWDLEALHEQFTTQFEAAAGFGYVRMRRVRPDDLEPLPIDLVQMPVAVSSKWLGKVDSTGANQLHQRVTYDILNADKIGYVRDRQHVAGFQPHSPTELSDVIRGFQSCDQEAAEGPMWQLRRLELVSLLRHTPPRAYLAESLPPMDQLHHFEHRPLTEFEIEGLQQLRTEQDVFVEGEAGTIRMIGSLRASQDCLACHRGTKGRLLGALSYEFVPIEGAHGLLSQNDASYRQD